MSDLVTFARSMGIMLDSVPPIGVWRRYRTEDHPNKRNGAVKFMGDHAFLQNWAVDQDVVVWKSEAGVDMAKIRRATEQAEQRRKQQQESAARKAAWILKECQAARHAYLKAKGFEEDYGNVWVSEGEQILVIPMRVDGRIVGCQMIREDGSKKFLLGQRTTGAEYLIDNKGPHLLVEGYATALSVRAALASMKRRYTLHIAFSAGNLVKLASRYPRGFVIADNDESKTGEKAAQETGWPYFMPPTPGQDFNDFHREVGLFKAATALHKAMITACIPSR